jgi:hypothetical protein
MNRDAVAICPKDHLVIAVDPASVDHHGIGVARWDLIAAIREAVPEPETTTTQCRFRNWLSRPPIPRHRCPGLHFD